MKLKRLFARLPALSFAFLIVPLVFAAGPPLSPGDYAVIKPSLFKGIRNVARQVVEYCPPPDCVVVGVGRSPSTVTLFLDEVNPGSVADLPLSGFRHSLIAEPYAGNLAQSLRPLLPPQEKQLFRHFDRYLGELLKGKPRRVVFLDYAAQGYTLYAAESYFKKYVKERGLDLQVDALALVRKGPVKTLEANAKHYGTQAAHPLYLDSDSVFTELLNGQSLDSVARYESFLISHGDVAVRENQKPLRFQFEKDLKEYVRTDPGVLRLFPRSSAPHACLHEWARELLR